MGAAVLGALASGEHFSKEDTLQVGILAHRFGLLRDGPTVREDTLTIVAVAAGLLEEAGLVAVCKAGEISAWELWLSVRATGQLSPEEVSTLDALTKVGKAVNLNRVVREVFGLKSGEKGYDIAWEKAEALVRALAEKPLLIPVRYTDNAATGFDVWLEGAS